jgi:glycosyltransferase involved in cell wall biosynthesis
MTPLVSTIIPTYNRAALLTRALDSVIAQTYRPIEVVVVDDGSTDDTPQVMEEYRKKLLDNRCSLIYHEQANGRAPKARNNGIRLSHGALIAFLDSDDLWYPELIDTLVRLLNEHPSAGLAFSGIQVIDENDRPCGERWHGLNSTTEEGLLRKPFDLIMRHMPTQTSGVMLRRSVIEHLGDFDLDLPVVEDWDLWYRVSKAYDFAYTKRALACNRNHVDNLPKADKVALTSGLRMNLKHLPDIQDEEARKRVLERMQRQFTLLQEELLREGRGRDGLEHLLAHELAPRTTRYALGSFICKGPEWVRQVYGRLVRAIGTVKRGFGC